MKQIAVNSGSLGVIISVTILAALAAVFLVYVFVLRNPVRGEGVRLVSRENRGGVMIYDIT